MARATLCRELPSTSGSLFSPSPSPDLKANEYAFLYGYGVTLNHEEYSPTIVQIHFGIGKIDGNSRGKKIPDGYEFDFSNKYEEIQHSVLGLAFNLQFIRKISEKNGWGMKLYGNINKEYPLYGIGIYYSVGQF